MHGGDDESPGSHESGYGGNPAQPSGYGGVPSGYGGFPSQPWSWNQPPPAWASSPTPPPSQPWRSSPTQPLARNLSRSAFGDYRPSFDSLNHPRPETPLQSSQSPFTDVDQDALDTMMDLISSGVPDTPVTTRVGGSQRGGGGGGGGGSGNVSGAGGSGSGVGSGGGSQSGEVQVGRKKPIHYTKADPLLWRGRGMPPHQTPYWAPIRPSLAFGSASCRRTTSSNLTTQSRVTGNSSARSGLGFCRRPGGSRAYTRTTCSMRRVAAARLT